MGDSAILSAICQIGIFIICAQTISHFKPKASYEQYFKLLISLMILVQIVVPISDFFSFGKGSNLEERMERIQEELLEQMTVSEEEVRKSEEIVEQMKREAERTALEEAQDTAAETDGQSGEASQEDTASRIEKIKTIEILEIQTGKGGE